MKFILATYDENRVPLDEDGKPLDVFDRINQSFMNLGVETAMQEFSRPQTVVDTIAEEVALAGGSPAERLFLALSDLRDSYQVSSTWGEDDRLDAQMTHASSLLDELRATVLP